MNDFVQLLRRNTSIENAFHLSKQAADRIEELERENAELKAALKPLPAKVTEEMHQAACKVLLRATGMDGTPQRMLDAMRATAPPAQPDVKPGEPVAWMHTGGHVQVRNPQWPQETADLYTVGKGWTPLYTAPPAQPDVKHGVLMSDHWRQGVYRTPSTNT